MLSKSESRKRISENSGHGKLLNEIESLSKALHLDRTTPRSLMSTISSRSKAVGKKSNSGETKSKIVKKYLIENDSNKKSLWGWKGFKALTHKRFKCCFSLQVHCVEGLPKFFDNLTLIVHWRRRDAEMTTRGVTVVEGVAEFEEQLKHSCSVYGTGNGPYHSAKYEAKHFLLCVSVYGVPDLDLGKHRVDLTRLLPLTLEELEGENSYGKWTTSFGLSGKAKGAILNVSFGYNVLQNKNIIVRTNNGSGAIVRLPSKISVSKRSLAARFAESSVSRLEFSESVNVLYQKLEEEKFDVSDNNNYNVESSKPDLKLASEGRIGNGADESEIVEFSVIEKGIELTSEEKIGVDSIGNSHDFVEFLDMLGIEDSSFGLSYESEPDSPRERLLRQFEKDTLASGNSLFNFDIEREDTMNKTTASMLEDLETKVLMQEFGLDGRAFRYSPPNSSGFGSPIELPRENLNHLPPLGNGFGSVVETKNGGFLRSMNPSLFKNARISGRLILQVSSPVVMPAEMGPGVMDILKHLASIGIEKFSMQAHKLMPLEDITGKTMQQIALEDKFQGKLRDSEYVSLDDIAPLAMDRIQSLSIEGLRIQCEDTPSRIGEYSDSEGKTVIFGLMNIKDNADEVDGLMGLCVSLDEWMNLDSGEINDEDDGIISERTSKLLSKRGSSKGKLSRCGLLSNNFTVALMVHLHDPLRNFEPVGSPMLTLVQVERVFVPPKPNIHTSVSQVRCNNEEDDDDAKKDEIIPQYKINEVHVVGLKSDQGRKKVWGSTAQQQSGSRWLVANGMGKKNKHPLMKSKASNNKSYSLPGSTTKVQPGDKLWSISSRVKGKRWLG